MLAGTGIGRIASAPALTVRRLVATALLAIFAITNYAVQTHIHGAYAAAHTAIAGTAITASSGNGTPADNDEQHCPFCQAFLSGGSFVSPVILVIALPALVGLIAPPLFVGRSARTLSHNWQGRGPPRA